MNTKVHNIEGIILPMDGEIYPCPICEEDSVFVERLDRFVHMDGSSNSNCWATMTRMPIGSNLFLKMWEKMNAKSIQ